MSNNTALVTIDTMPSAEARMLHMEVKNRGRGAVGNFIKYETAHTSNQYYYRLRKKGVMPIAPSRGNNGSVVEFKSSRAVSSQVRELESKIVQLEMALQVASITPAMRALAVLNSNMDSIGHRSRLFLASLIGKNLGKLTEKQETWLSDLERKSV